MRFSRKPGSLVSQLSSVKLWSNHGEHLLYFLIWQIIIFQFGSIKFVEIFGEVCGFILLNSSHLLKKINFSENLPRN